MLNTRNVIRIITTTNEISTGKIGIRKQKKPSIAQISKYNNPTFKTIDRQNNFAEDIVNIIYSNTIYFNAPSLIQKSSGLLDLFFQENRSYFDASFIFNVDPTLEEKVNDSIRDREIEKLCDLNNVYFRLPIDVICDAVSIIDRFISKVKVGRKKKKWKKLTESCFR